MESAPLVPSQKSFVSLVVSLVVCRCKRMNNNTRMTGKLTQLTNADASAQKENKKKQHLRGDIRENKTKNGRQVWPHRCRRDFSSQKNRKKKIK